MLLRAIMHIQEFKIVFQVIVSTKAREYEAKQQRISIRYARNSLQHRCSGNSSVNLFSLSFLFIGSFKSQ